MQVGSSRLPIAVLFYVPFCDGRFQNSCKRSQTWSQDFLCAELGTRSAVILQGLTSSGHCSMMHDLLWSGLQARVGREARCRRSTELSNLTLRRRLGAGRRFLTHLASRDPTSRRGYLEKWQKSLVMVRENTAVLTPEQHQQSIR